MPSDEKDKIVHVRAAASKHMDPRGLPGGIAGIPVEAGDSVLLPYQREAAGNGVYIVRPGFWERVNDRGTEHDR